MVWEKKGDVYSAEGKYGSFRIIKRGTFYYPEFSTNDFKWGFRMPRRKYIADAKAICEKNRYWEKA